MGCAAMDRSLWGKTEYTNDITQVRCRAVARQRTIFVGSAWGPDPTRRAPTARHAAPTVPSYFSPAYGLEPHAVRRHRCRPNRHRLLARPPRGRPERLR